ncbi:MAG: SMC-Scp complex subunit ScpB [Candidatus Anstonellales archaeon]
MLKNIVEIILFLSADEVSIDEIAKRAKAKREDVEQALNELMNEYQNSGSALTIIRRGNHYVMTIKDNFLDIAKKLTHSRELSKKELSLLAIIEKRPGIAKSFLAKKLGPSIYNNIKELVKRGFIIEKKDKKQTQLFITDKYRDYIKE